MICWPFLITGSEYEFATSFYQIKVICYDYFNAFKPDMATHKILRICLCRKECSDSEPSDATDKPLSPHTFTWSPSSIHSTNSPLASSVCLDKRPLPSTRSFTCTVPQITSTLKATTASQTSVQPQPINMSIDDEVVKLG